MAGVYDIVEYTHKEFFKTLGADIRIKKVGPKIFPRSLSSVYVPMLRDKT
jgi:hypothetical protein